MASTLANVALVAKAGYDPGNPMFFHKITIDLKADYDAAGILLFSALAAVKAAIGLGRTVLAVVPINCKGLGCRYDAATDTLFFLWGNYDGADGPLIDVPTTDMATYTDLELGVISQ